MTIAYDAISNATEGTGNLSWTRTPAGTPRGASAVQNTGTASPLLKVAGDRRPS